jgi:uncharacterized protein YcbK (DUF882 family)
MRPLSRILGASVLAILFFSELGHANAEPTKHGTPSRTRSDHKRAEAKKDPKRAYIGRSPNPGVVKGNRLATNEEFSIRAGTRGRPGPEANKKFAHMMRATTGVAHGMDARLLALLGKVSDHFGGRKIEVISGYRPYTPKQYTKDSRHNHGHAVDFRVTGVPNTVLRDYCRTLQNTGCGYYPNSVFVHMDTREAPAYWIDYSRPGEAPRYHSPNHDADEGTSDVHADHDVAKKDESGTTTEGDTAVTPEAAPSTTPLSTPATTPDPTPPAAR